MVLKAKVINPRKVELLNTGINSWVAVLEPYDKGKSTNIESFILSPSIHGNNSSLN